MYLSLMEKMVEELKCGRRGVLCILMEQSGSMPREAGASMWVYQGGGIEGTLGGGPMEYECIKEAVDMMSCGDTVRIRNFDLGEGLGGTPSGPCPEGAVCGGEGRVYFELMSPETEIFIFGAGHVGSALARLAVCSGYRVTVWDEREEFASEEKLRGAKVLTSSLAELFEQADSAGLFHANTYVVVVTRGHALDGEVMRLMEGREAAYIGVIGSRGKIAFVDRQLRERGVSGDYLEGMFRPIGLPIKAETPEEIAICILAEIVAVQRGADIKALRGEG